MNDRSEIDEIPESDPNPLDIDPRPFSLWNDGFGVWVVSDHEPHDVYTPYGSLIHGAEFHRHGESYSIALGLIPDDADEADRLQHEPWRASTYSDYPPSTEAERAQTCVAPGTYYPRMWRHGGGISRLVWRSLWRREIAQTSWTLSNIERHLTDIFAVIDPAPRNGSAYGHAIRHALILLCTEVESGWRAIATANHLPSSGGRYTTKDYAELGPVMRLGEYAVEFADFADLPAFSPFKEWDRDRPTQSLPWYEAYNATKHDRENALHSASLDLVLNALAAVEIVREAQFGPDRQRRPFGARIFPPPRWAAEDTYWVTPWGGHLGPRGLDSREWQPVSRWAPPPST